MCKINGNGTTLENIHRAAKAEFLEINERKPTSYAMAAAIALLLVLTGVGIWQQRIPIPGLEQTVETIGEKIRHVSQPAEVLVGTEKNIVEEQTESAKSTETISEPMQLIPIEEVPAGAVKKAEEAAPSTQPAEEKEKPVAVENTQNYYVVQQGDTLSGICKQAYGSMKKLKELEKANDLEDSDAYQVEFIRTNHSIQDAAALAIYSPAGIVLHTGDFKVDYTPVFGDAIDLQRFGEIGKKGVLALLCDSTNAERPGFTDSEKSVGKTLDNIFSEHKNTRIIIATFASNVDRVQQIINSADKFGRKVAIEGRSMVNIVS